MSTGAKVAIAIVALLIIIFTLKSFWISHILSIILSVATIVCNIIFLPDESMDKLIPVFVFGASVLYLFGEFIFDSDDTGEWEGVWHDCGKFWTFEPVSGGFLGFSLICTAIAGVIFGLGAYHWPPLCYILPVVVVGVDIFLLKYIG